MEKQNLNINTKVFFIILTSVLFGITIVFLFNLFSDEWYFKKDKYNTYFKLWENNGNYNHEMLEKAKQNTPMTVYQLNSFFGNTIEKRGNTGYVWGDYEWIGTWVKGDLEKGKFIDPSLNIYFTILLTFKDWIYILAFSMLFMIPRLFLAKYRVKFN